MIVALAFLSGVGVTAASILLPHARGSKTSIEEFANLQSTLAKLPTSKAQKQQNASF